MRVSWSHRWYIMQWTFQIQKQRITACQTRDLLTHSNTRTHAQKRARTRVRTHAHTHISSMYLPDVGDHGSSQPCLLLTVLPSLCTTLLGRLFVAFLCTSQIHYDLWLSNIQCLLSSIFAPVISAFSFWFSV